MPKTFSEIVKRNQRLDFCRCDHATAWHVNEESAEVANGDFDLKCQKANCNCGHYKSWFSIKILEESHFKNGDY